MATYSNAELVAQLYVGFYDRAPDPVGLDYWVGRLAAGVSMQDIGDSFAASPEASDTYAFFKYPGLLSPNDFLAEVYLNVFGRKIDPDGLKYYSDRMADGESAGSIVASILGNASTNEGSPDQAFLQNKVDAGLHWALQAAATNANIYDADGHLTASANGSAHSTLDGITADPATVDAANSASDAYFTIGDIFTLTTAVDNLAGGNGADTFTATVNGPNPADGSTLNNGDTINGGAGTDTLRIIQSAAGAAQYVPNLTSVENIDVQSFGGGLTLNLGTSTGVKALSLTNGSSGLTATNVGNIVDLALNNTTAGTLTATYMAAVVAGTADVQNVAINSANGSVSVAGVETMNVSVTGAQGNTGGNAVNLVGGALKTINVSGDGNLTTTLATSVTTLDASAATGNISATISGAMDVKVTGGAGNDTFNFGASLTTADVVNGGEGHDAVGLDGLDLTAAGAAGTRAAINALTSVEQLNFAGAATTINHSTITNASIDTVSFTLAAAAAANVRNALSAVDYQFLGDANGAATFDMKGGNTVLNVDLISKDTNINTDADISGLTVNLAGVDVGAVATINLSSAGGLFTGQVNQTGNISAVAGSTVNLSGDADLTIASSTNSITVDASTFTGDLDIRGSVNVTPGAAGTATVTTQGIDTITLGSGSDTIHFNNVGTDSGIIEFAGAGGVATGNILVDTIKGFTAGADGDVLDIITGAATYTALAAATQTNIDALSGVGATLFAAASIATTAHTGTGWTAFSFQGSTYALYEDAADAANFTNADTLVHLVGVSVADLTSANFA